MAGQLVNVTGKQDWRMSQDREGNREYKLKLLVHADADDGPYVVSRTPGLPVPGTFWVIGNDSDLWATCKLDCTFTPVLTKEPNNFWDCEFRFAVKGDEKKCQDQSITDPLLIPVKISGGFAKYQEEAVYDRFGTAIVNSAFEQIRGPQNEWDRNRPNVKIEMNVPVLNLGLVAPMIDKVNSHTLWGLSPRCVKLSSFTWERKFYGQCYVYYTWNFEFDIRYETFDRDLLDEGTKVLGGPDSKWDNTSAQGAWLPAAIPGYTGFPNPDPNNPSHFMKAVDRTGQPMKVVLDGHGKPAFVTATHPDCVSIVDNNIGHDLPPDFVDAPAFWCQLTGVLYTLWNAAQVYNKGDMVYSAVGPATGLFVAKQTTFNTDPDTFPGTWALLGIGGRLNPLPEIDFKGPWDATIKYAIGDSVSNPNTLTNAGNIHVEKYDAADFASLGIPLIL